MAGLADILAELKANSDVTAAGLDGVTAHLDELVKHFSTAQEVQLEWAQAAESSGKKATEAARSTNSGIGAALSGMQAGFRRTADVMGALGQGMARTGLQAQLAFGVASAGLLGFVRAGLQGTAEGERFGVMMGFLSREIGSIFKPQIDALLGGLERLVDWFSKLDGGQQQLINRFAQAAAAGLLVAAIMPKIILGISGVISSVIALTTATSVLDVVTGGILPVVGALVTGFVALGAASFVMTNGFEGAWKVIKPLVDTLKSGFLEAWAAVQPLVAVLSSHFAVAAAQSAEFLANALKLIGPVAAEVIGILSDAFAELSPKILEQGQALNKLAIDALPYLLSATKAAAEGLAFLSRMFGDVVENVTLFISFLVEVRDFTLEVSRATDTWRDSLLALNPGLQEVNALLKEQLAFRIALRFA